MKQTRKNRKEFQRTAMLAFAVEPRMKNKIDRFAKREDVSRSQAIRLLLECGLHADGVN